MIGKLVENYKILEQLSDNDQTAVFKAVDLSLKRLVLIKVLEQKSAENQLLAENFRREAAVLARFVHPAVPTLHTLMEINDEIFMIAEFPEGETLENILRREKFSAEKASKICAQIFDCLESAHKIEIFHNGLQSDDIVVSDAGMIKILNFGAFAGNDSVKAIDKIKTDIRSVAVLIYEMLSGKKLFAANVQAAEIETAILPEHLSVVKSDLPAKIGAVISEVLRPKKFDPFQTVGAFRAALTTSGFDVSSGEKIDFKSESAEETKKISENSTNISAEQQNFEKDSAVYTVSFSENQVDRPINDFGKAPSDLISEKNSSSRYKIAGAAVLLVLVTHFVWQFSFIQEENLRAAETEFELIQPIGKPGADDQNKRAAEIETEAPIKTIEPEIVQEDDDEESPKPIKIVKTVQPSVRRQSETKSVPKNKAAREMPVRETRAERLRRAEKLLTGF